MNRSDRGEIRNWPEPTRVNRGIGARIALPLAAIGVGLIASMFAGCRRNGASPSPDVPDKQSHTYIIRGVIEKLPSNHTHPRLLTVHMETIDKFYQPNGKPTKMSAMTMPFPLAKSVSAAGLKVREKVRMTLVVDWPKNINHITKITPLPPSTRLRLTSPKSAKGNPMTMPGM